jgi:hypothetical protein
VTFNALQRHLSKYILEQDLTVLGSSQFCINLQQNIIQLGNSQQQHLSTLTVPLDGNLGTSSLLGSG